MDNAGTIALAAVALVLIGFSQTAGDARAFAAKHRYRIDINQESVAQGVANVGAGLFQGMPVSTSLSASSLNDHSGAQHGSGVAHVRRDRPPHPALPGAAVLRPAQAGAGGADHRGRRDGHDGRAGDAPPARVQRFDFWIAVAAHRRHARLRGAGGRHHRDRPLAALARLGRHASGDAGARAASRAPRSSGSSTSTPTTSSSPASWSSGSTADCSSPPSDALEDRVREVVCRRRAHRDRARLRRHRLHRLAGRRQDGRHARPHRRLRGDPATRPGQAGGSRSSSVTASSSASVTTGSTATSTAPSRPSGQPEDPPEAPRSDQLEAARVVRYGFRRTRGCSSVAEQPPPGGRRTCNSCHLLHARRARSSRAGPLLPSALPHALVACACRKKGGR